MDFSVPMALVDYIPVLLFGVSAVILQRMYHDLMTKGGYALLCAGTVMVTAAGICKATWKLLYALNICDFEALNHVFFPMQALGFLFAGLSMLGYLFFKVDKKKNEDAALPAVAAAPAVYSGTMIFVTLMILGVAGLCFGLGAEAKRRKKPLLIINYAISFVLLLGMGYMATRDNTSAAVNWIAEGMNIGAQVLFLLANKKLAEAVSNG